MHTRRFHSTLTALVTVAALVSTAAIPAQAVTPDPALASKLRALMTDYRVTGTGDLTGLVVLDGGSGAEIYARNGSRAIAPASNLKLVTAAAALDLLGADHRFITSVATSAKPTAGLVSGDLYLKGDGDPSLLEADLAELADQVGQAGITRVAGRLVYDASAFDNDRYNDYWTPSLFTLTDNAQIAALTLAPDPTFRVGTVAVDYTPTSYGARAKLAIRPASARSHFKLVNKTVTSARGTGDRVTVTRLAGTNTIVVSGRVAQGRDTNRRYTTVGNPARYAAIAFRTLLARRGITIAGGTSAGVVPGTTTRLARHQSAPLSELIVPMMKLSVNGYAEALVKTLGRKPGVPGSFAAGGQRLIRWLAERGLPTTNLVIRDGSGNAQANRLTARVVAAVLQQAQAEPWFAAFDAALPVAGNPALMIGGTLRKRLVGTIAADNVHAKTGTIQHVTALSGYAIGVDRRRYVFSMLSDYAGSSPRPVENKLAVLLAGWSRPA